jgi:hypothetical protein
MGVLASRTSGRHRQQTVPGKYCNWELSLVLDSREATLDNRGSIFGVYGEVNDKMQILESVQPDCACVHRS